MERPDSEAAVRVYEALGDVRDALFDVAAQANALPFRDGKTDVHTFIQSASYNLGEAERELSSA